MWRVMKGEYRTAEFWLAEPADRDEVNNYLRWLMAIQLPPLSLLEYVYAYERAIVYPPRVFLTSSNES